MKRDVDLLLAMRAAQVFAGGGGAEGNSLVAQMRADPSLVLLLLEAPCCATTAALFNAMPPLRQHAAVTCYVVRLWMRRGTDIFCETSPLTTAQT